MPLVGSCVIWTSSLFRHTDFEIRYSPGRFHQSDDLPREMIDSRLLLTGD
jgi:hypothetical protein